MGERGPKSSKELEVSRVAHINAIQRPQAPEDLKHPEETDVWWEIVNSKPADWFPIHTHGLLKAYCRHSANADRLSTLLNVAWSQPNPDLKEINQLSLMFERDTRSLSALATRMRISQQATYDAKRLKGNNVGPTLEHGSYIR